MAEASAANAPVVVPFSSKPVAELKGHTGAITDLAISRDGTFCASAGDNTIRFWDVKERKRLRSCKCPDPESWISSVDISPDSKLVLSSSFDSTVCLWEASSGKQLLSIDGQYSMGSTARFAPDGGTFVMTVYSRGLIMCDTASGKELHRLTGEPFTAVCWLPGGNSLAAGLFSGAVIFFDTTSRKELRRLKLHTGAVNCLGTSAAGGFLASGSNDKRAAVWSVTDGRCIKTFTHTEDVQRLCMSADSSTLFTATWCSGAFVMSVTNNKPPAKLCQDTCSIQVASNDAFLLAGQRGLPCRVLVFEPVKPP